ncbi:hypothetical protein BS78_02G082100 [Paspalum vaginatum]|nr:hypothetical protein BS78_02G082100 [Paspalum vaginatum]
MCATPPPALLASSHAAAACHSSSSPHCQAPRPLDSGHTAAARDLLRRLPSPAALHLSLSGPSPSRGQPRHSASPSTSSASPQESAGGAPTIFVHHRTSSPFAISLPPVGLRGHGPEAWALGAAVWEEADALTGDVDALAPWEEGPARCPGSLVLGGGDVLA